MSKNVLILGITGYIGGSIFTTLHATHPTFTYTALVRSSSDTSTISTSGATPIIGSASDHTLVSRLAFEADIVINCADADNVGLTEAILEGMRKRKEEGRSLGVLVHTSGSAVFGSLEKEGRRGRTEVFSDRNVDHIKAITTERVHGPVDVLILRATEAGDIHSYIICPSAIHGLGTGPVERSRVSSFAKLVVSGFRGIGRAIYVGEGTNEFGLVHISDLTSLYLLVFNHALSNITTSSKPVSSYEQYFIASTRSLPWKSFSTLFGAAMQKRGAIPSTGASAVSVSFEEAGQFAPALALDSVTITDGGRAKDELGWKPSGPSFEDSVGVDVDRVLNL